MKTAFQRRANIFSKKIELENTLDLKYENCTAFNIYSIAKQHSNHFNRSLQAILIYAICASIFVN